MYTDTTPMPWGMHKGKAMANVPDSYLKYLWENGKCHGDLKRYIQDNLAVINTNIHRQLNKTN